MGENRYHKTKEEEEEEEGGKERTTSLNMQNKKNL